MSRDYKFLLIFICIINSAYGQMPDSLVRKVDAIFADYDKTNSPGCALAILKDGKIIYERGYGMSNMEYNIAISPGSIFHVASISKQFTAAALVKLSLEGKLSLDDDIRKYIPEVPDFGHVITFNHLIHHTSGLRDQWDLQGLAGWRDDDVITEGDIMDMLARQKALNFLPGEEYSYCNTGYTLAGIAVKKITGVSLRVYADSVFFKPLGMTSTHFHSDHSEITPNRTSAYVKDNKGKWKISIPVFDNYGATSLFTTVEDLSKWDENFYSKKIGGDAFLKAMQRTGTLNNGTTQTYASGLVIQSYKGHQTVDHGGADAGYRSYFLRFPEQHLAVVLLANLANLNTRVAAYKVADVFIKGDRSKEPTGNVDNSKIKGWAGEYFHNQTQMIMKLNYKGEKLLMGTTVLIPSNNNSFTDPGFTSDYSFSGDSASAKLELYTKGVGSKTLFKVKRVTLLPAALQEYTGEFYSQELDTKYKISVKENGLVIKIPRNDDIKLSPFTKDIFTGDFSLQFSRDKKNKVSGFLLTTGRVRNLSFEKIDKK